MHLVSFDIYHLIHFYICTIQFRYRYYLSRYLYINRHQYIKKDTYHILLRVVHSGPSLQNRKKHLLLYKTICNLFWTRFNPRKTSYYSVPQLLLVTIVSIKQRVSLSSVNYDQCVSVIKLPPQHMSKAMTQSSSMRTHLIVHLYRESTTIFHSMKIYNQFLNNKGNTKIVYVPYCNRK